MRLLKPIQHGFTSLALISLVAAGCGSDDNGNGVDVDAGDDNGIDAGDNGEDEGNLFTYVDSIVIPLDGDGNPTCCIEDNGDILNAYAEIVAQLNVLPDVDFQETIDEQLDDGRLILLGEHVDLEGTSGAFTLNALRGNFEGGTGRSDAEAGDGEFSIDELSFDDQGNPRLSFAAEIDDGELSASADSITLLLPVADAALPFITRDVSVIADADVSEDAASYTSGELSGYFLVDETMEMFNDFLESEQCDCLDLNEGESVFEKDGDDWTAAHCVVDALDACDGEGEVLCGTMANDGGVCDLLPDAINDAVDSEVDGDDALSVGFEWSGVPAEVVAD